MKGRELEFRYFHDLGKALIEAEFPDLLGRIAVTGTMGSQARGHDDEVSRDHSWGPSFFVWMTDEDYAERGEAVEARLNALLPDEYLGHYKRDLHRHQGKKVYVVPLRASLDRMLGCHEPPARPIDWLKMPEPKLSDLASLIPFHDPAGLYGSVKERFRYYPDDIRLHLLGVQLTAMAEWGSYQLLRAMRRPDVLSQALYWGRYVEAVMRVGFLMSRIYAPFHKWLDREFHQLGGPAAEIAAWLDAATLRPEKREAAIAAVQDRMIGWLIDEKLTTLTPDYRRVTWWDEALADFGHDVRQPIADPEIRDLPVTV